MFEKFSSENFEVAKSLGSREKNLKKVEICQNAPTPLRPRCKVKNIQILLLDWRSPKHNISIFYLSERKYKCTAPHTIFAFFLLQIGHLSLKLSLMPILTFQIPYFKSSHAFRWFDFDYFFRMT